MKEYLEPVSDEIIEDNLGGIFGKKNAKNGSKTILIAGHLDEIDLWLRVSMMMVTLNSQQSVDGGTKLCFHKSNDYNR